MRRGEGKKAKERGEDQREKEEGENPWKKNKEREGLWKEPPPH